MQKITSHLWYDKEAKEAAELYTSVFSNSKIVNTNTLHDTPSGDVDVVDIELRGQRFTLLSAGPYFKFNPSISFMVNFDPSIESDAEKSLNRAWEKLLEGGKVLMPLQEYPFSKRYGWLEDKYGLSWQLILTDPQGEDRPEILPSLLFVDKLYGKVEDAIKFYLSVFKDSKMGAIAKYGPDQAPDKEGAVMFADFRLLDRWFAAMESAREHNFTFNEAVSFMVHCKDQAEIDYYWKKLSAVPEAEQCGWLKDKFGVSWQIVPDDMDEMMNKGTPEQVARVTEAFLQMKKFDLAKLRKAYQGK